MPKEPFVFLTEGRNAWQIGITGYFARARGIATTIVISIIFLTGPPFWWPKTIASELTIYTRYFAFFVILLTGVAVSSLLYYFRIRSIRSLDIKAHLHELSHFLRDEQTKAYKRHSSNEGHNDQHEGDRLRKFSADVCERVKSYFTRMTNDSTLEVAIRLAIEKDGHIVYHTVGRSFGLSSKRAETTEDIPANVGTPGFFSTKKTNGSSGVIIVNDLLKAAASNCYHMTNNDKNYSDEIKTMMVAPLNAWDGNKQSMIGILYITSRRSDTFSVKYVDSVRFVADAVANSMAFCS